MFGIDLKYPNSSMKYQNTICRIHYGLNNRWFFVIVQIIASIDQVDLRLTSRSREISKPRYSGLDFSNNSEI